MSAFDFRMRPSVTALPASVRYSLWARPSFGEVSRRMLPSFSCDRRIRLR